MSLNEDKDVEEPNKPAVPPNAQEELVHVIQMSLNNIATQVDNLNKNAEGILGALSKEVDKISSRYTILQECVVQLNNSITEKDTSNESLRATKAKSSQSASIQTELDYTYNPLPAKTCETHDVSVQTSSLPHWQDNPQVLAVRNCQEDRESLIIPYYQDDLMIPCCQHSEPEVMIPYCMDSEKGLPVSPDISYYFETCEEKFVAGVKEQVQERFRKKNQCVDHLTEPENGRKITLMTNDITVHHNTPTCIELSPSPVAPSADGSGYPTYEINEISKVLTQAVGKVLAKSPGPQKKDERYLRNKQSYVRYGTGKRDIKTQVQTPNHPKLEVFVSPTLPASQSPLPPDWLALLRDSKTEYSAFKVHSQTQFPSPIMRTTKATHHYNHLQTRPEVGVQTTEAKEDFFPFLHPHPAPCPECCEMTARNLLKQENRKEETAPMSTSPTFLQRIETKEKSSDLFIHASFVQLPSSLVYQSAKSVFSQSPRLSASKSPRPSVLTTPRSSHQSPTSYISSTCSKSSNAAEPKHSSLETYQNSIPLAESFPKSSRSPVSSARCPSAYSPNRSASPRHFDARSSRFSIPSSGKTYIEQSTSTLIPTLQQSSGTKSTKSVTLQSLFSFPQSASSSVPNSHTLSLFQYSEDPVSPDPVQSSGFNKRRDTLLESIRKGVLLHKTEEHCILKAQIEISKK